MTLQTVIAILGAVASLLCTIIVGALAFFLKKTLSCLEEADKRNEAKIEKVEKDLNDLKADLPLIYVLRDDFVRIMNRVEEKLDKLIYSGVTCKHAKEKEESS